MRWTSLLLIVISAGCNTSTTPATENQTNDSRKSATASGSNKSIIKDPPAENPDIAAIRVEYSRINTVSADSAMYEFQCDEKTKAVVYKEGGQIVKAVVDWGWVGDAATVTEYYYKNGQLIFRYVKSVGGIGDQPNTVSEARTYVKDNKVIRYLQGGREVPCTDCRFDASAKEYALLEADTNDEMRAALCR